MSYALLSSLFSRLVPDSRLLVYFPLFSKPHNSKVHFSVTTYEPYGVCCIQGLKISMGMHNFGEKRWGVGLLDDVSCVV